MTLPKDPYVITTEQLVEADKRTLAELEAKRQGIEVDIGHLKQRLTAYEMVLEAYRQQCPRSPQNSFTNPYADEAEVALQLQGLTNLQKLIMLGLMNDKHLKVNEGGRLMHRIGAINGQWKYVPSRLYHLIEDHPKIFRWTARGEYVIEPGAELYLPDNRRPTQISFSIPSLSGSSVD